MKILFIERENVDLYETLMDSETSRVILRFYAPQRHSLGVSVSVASLGIGLSLVSELRWYIRRYMKEVLFELQNGVFCTYTLAKEVYERDIRLEGEGIRRTWYSIQDHKIPRIISSSTGKSRQSSDSTLGTGEVLEVWSLENETVDIFKDKTPPDEEDENHLREGL